MRCGPENSVSGPEWRIPWSRGPQIGISGPEQRNFSGFRPEKGEYGPGYPAKLEDTESAPASRDTGAAKWMIVRSKLVRGSYNCNKPIPSGNRLCSCPKPPGIIGNNTV